MIWQVVASSITVATSTNPTYSVLGSPAVTAFQSAAVLTEAANDGMAGQLGREGEEPC